MTTRTVKLDPPSVTGQQEREVRILGPRRPFAFALVAAIGVTAPLLVAMDRHSDDTTMPATTRSTITRVAATTEGVGTASDHPDAQPTGVGDSDRTRAKTRVTIRVVERGFRYRILGGVLQSTRPSRCAEDREVVVFRQFGSEQDPKTEQRMSSDTAALRGDRYVWRTRHEAPNGGRLYAHVARTRFCGADTSKTIRVSIPG